MLTNGDQNSALAEPCTFLFDGLWMCHLGHHLMSTDTLDIYRALDRYIYVEYNPLDATLGTSLDVHCHISYLSSTG